MPRSGGLETLAGESEVQITFTSSRTKKARTIPVWFTIHEGRMELLPMYGLKTKWFVDVQRSGEVELRVKDWARRTKPSVIREAEEVSRIKRRFGEKYGIDDVKKYYPTSEVALLIAP